MKQTASAMRSPKEVPGLTFPMNTLQIDGSQIAFLDTRVGNAAILLIHGHPFDHTMWMPQIEFLRHRYRVIAPDLRGYGRSTLPQDSRETGFNAFAQDLLDLMDTLEVNKFVVGGLSMGGQIVMEMYRQAPARISALILTGTFSGSDSHEIKQSHFTTADRIEREGIAQYARELLPRMITRSTVEQSPAVALHVLKMMTNASSLGAAAALRGSANRIDYTPMLRQIQVPSLVAVGTEDAFTPVEIVSRLHENIRGSMLAVIENAGHLPNLEQAERFNQFVEMFLWIALGPGQNYRNHSAVRSF